MSPTNVALLVSILAIATPPTPGADTPQHRIRRHTKSMLHVFPGHCSCGCPTADLRLPEDTSRVEARHNPIGDAIGEVSGKTVGVMLLQSDGYLRCLEIYDLSDIEHPYGLPI